MDSHPLELLQLNHIPLRKPSLHFIFQALATPGLILSQRVQAVFQRVFPLELYGNFASQIALAIQSNVGSPTQ